MAQLSYDWPAVSCLSWKLSQSSTRSLLYNTAKTWNNNKKPLMPRKHFSRDFFFLHETYFDLFRSHPIQQVAEELLAILLLKAFESASPAERR